MAINVNKTRPIIQQALSSATEGSPNKSPTSNALNNASQNFPSSKSDQSADHLGLSAEGGDGQSKDIKADLEKVLAEVLVGVLAALVHDLAPAGESQPSDSSAASGDAGGVGSASSVSPSAASGAHPNSVPATVGAMQDSSGPSAAAGATGTSSGPSAAAGATGTSSGPSAAAGATGTSSGPSGAPGPTTNEPTSLTGMQSAGPVKTTGDMGPGGNPSIVFFQGKYYSSQANFNSTVTITSSTNLNDAIRGDGDSITYTSNTPNMKTESPNLSVVNDPQTGKQTLAMYTTNMNGPGSGSIDFSMLADPSNPSKGFVNRGTIPGVSGYDPHAVTLPNGKMYLFSSNFQNIQATPLLNPWTPAGPPTTVISAPPGSQGAGSLREAPATVVSGNKLSLVYASGDYRDASYQSNVATVDIDQVLNPSSWKHSNQPVFGTSNGITGPGSGTFVNSGNQTWWVYGYIAGGSGPAGRHVRAQTVGFDPSGEVQLGHPQ